MSHNIVEIKEGALFIADAHYPHHGREFFELLKALEEDRIKVPQLFLMGDIFDLLFGYGEYIFNFSKDAIKLLQKLSKKLEIYYLEGNHDFHLKKIFKDIRVYPREEQPIFMRYRDKEIALSHGDRYEVGVGYNIYSFILRNTYLVYILKPWERKVIDGQMKRLSLKNICHKYTDFEDKAKKILAHYPNHIDLVIEGHFHQGRKIGRYISLPSLACDKSVGVMRVDGIEFIDIKTLLVK